MITTHNIPRNDAVVIDDGSGKRHYVPTTDETIWVDTWAQFKAVGGSVCFSEDQTEIELALPVGHKFSIRFQR